MHEAQAKRYMAILKALLEFLSVLYDQGVDDWDVDDVSEALADIARASGLETRGLVVLLRGFGPQEIALEYVDAA